MTRPSKLMSLTLLVMLMVMPLLLFGHSAMAAAPTLAIPSFDTSEAGDVSYAGPALRTMLVSRLAAEQLTVTTDEFTSQEDSNASQASGADYTLKGKVIEEPGKRIVIELKLISRESTAPVSSWTINPPTEEGIIPETSRYAILIASTIKERENRKAIKAALASTSETAAQKEDKPLIDNEQLRLARIHPDLLYRETPEDQKGSKPIDALPEDEPKDEIAHQESEGEQAKAESQGPEEYDDDYMTPDYPPAYEDENHAGEGRRASGDTGDEDETLDYPPDYSSDSDVKQESTTTGRRKHAENQDDEWSIWPFGSEKEKKTMPAPVPEDRLPYPVPPDLENTESHVASIDRNAIADMQFSNRYGMPSTPVGTAYPAAGAPYRTGSTSAHQEEPPETAGRPSSADISRLNQLGAGAAEEEPLPESDIGYPEEDAAGDGEVSATASSEESGENVATQVGQEPEPKARPDVSGKAQASLSSQDETASRVTEEPVVSERPMPVPESSPATPSHVSSAAYVPPATGESAPLPESEFDDIDEPFAAGLSALSGPHARHPAAESQVPSTTLEAATLHGTSRSGSTSLDKGSPGWFSWLWPDAWKGTAKKPAPEKPAVRDESKPPAESTAPPAKGPVWVWN